MTRVDTSSWSPEIIYEYIFRFDNTNEPRKTMYYGLPKYVEPYFANSIHLKKFDTDDKKNVWQEAVLISWIIENIKGKWSIDRKYWSRFYFEKKEDLLFFKLVWVGDYQIQEKYEECGEDE